MITFATFKLQIAGTNEGKAMYGKICDFHKSELSALKLMGLSFYFIS